MTADAFHALTRRVAQLRAEGAGHVTRALLEDATDPQAVLEDIGRALGMRTVHLQELGAWAPQFALLPFTEVARRRCGLLLDEQGSLWLLVTDPFDADMLAWARTRFVAAEPVLITAQAFEVWLAQCEAGMSALSSVGVADDSGTGAASQHGELLSLRSIGADDSPAVRIVNSTLYDALRAGASDIHLESDPRGMGVKFRLDGVLTTIRHIDSRDLGEQAISRIKVMAQLDIAERRVPQDGRLQASYCGRSIDVRVSIMPSIHGEDAVLRILDRQHLAESLAGLTLAKLGFDERSAQALRALCVKPHGMLLATGPTGSGKTTTLYAAIAETHQSRDKIITIEDPVEYQLPGVLQIPVNERKGLTFARGLRSILRHDPDKILVGEIRDAETAQIAVQSALTGHLVFTTVHANTVFDVLGRFEQFGIDGYTFASAINGVLAQRLLRRVCSHCAVSVDPPHDLELQRCLHAVGATTVLLAKGCAHCRGTGYAGRFALGELLTLTPSMKAQFAQRAPQVQIQDEAVRSGWRSLRSQAMAAVASGVTTVEEVERVAA